ncbi:MAG: hypothetical protein SO434_08100 [Eubacteriales bacterium]|nr:hypothetical protein [Eubacteriales bacterium]
MDNINPQLKTYIAKQKQLAAQKSADASKKAQQAADENKKRQLIDAGLFTMVFDPEEKDVKSDEYPFLHYDTNTKKCVAYKKVPIELTDEEYQEFLKYYKPSSNNTTKSKATQENSNFRNTILYALGLLLIIASAIGGFFLFYVLDMFAVVVMVVGIALGIVMMVMSSVIVELKQIKNLIKRQNDNN